MDDLLLRRLRPSPQALESAVGEETVLLHLGNETYYGLDALGTRIWTLLKGGSEPGAVRDRLTEEYEVAPEVLEADLRRFLGDLLAQGLLVDA